MVKKKKNTKKQETKKTNKQAIISNIKTKNRKNIDKKLNAPKKIKNTTDEKVKTKNVSGGEDEQNFLNKINYEFKKISKFKI